MRLATQGVLALTGGAPWFVRAHDTADYVVMTGLLVAWGYVAARVIHGDSAP